jgi:hypothetical protein
VLWHEASVLHDLEHLAVHHLKLRYATLLAAFFERDVSRRRVEVGYDVLNFNVLFPVMDEHHKIFIPLLDQI